MPLRTRGQWKTNHVLQRGCAIGIAISVPMSSFDRIKVISVARVFLD